MPVAYGGAARYRGSYCASTLKYASIFPQLQTVHLINHLINTEKCTHLCKIPNIGIAILKCKDR